MGVDCDYPNSCRCGCHYNGDESPAAHLQLAPTPVWGSGLPICSREECAKEAAPAPPAPLEDFGARTAALGRLVKSFETMEELRRWSNAEIADLLSEHWQEIDGLSAASDLVAEVLDRLRALKTCPACHGYGYLDHVRCAHCEGTGDVERPQPAPLASRSMSADEAEAYGEILSESFTPAPLEEIKMLRLTLFMREAKAGCQDRACSNVALAALNLLAALASRPAPLPLEKATRLEPYADWHEDDGPVLWYAVPVTEPPYCGDPLTSGWPTEWNAPYDTVTGAFIDGPYTGKVLMWQRLPKLPPDAALAREKRGPR